MTDAGPARRGNSGGNDEGDSGSSRWRGLIVAFVVGRVYLPPMEEAGTVAAPPPEWVDSLDEAERDAAAGRVVPPADVHALLRERQRRDGPAPLDKAG